MVEHKYMKSFHLVLCVACLLCNISWAHLKGAKPLPPHVHGEGKLEFVVDYGEKSAKFDFELPADQVLGFEHHPKNENERKALADSKVLLATPTKMLELIADKDADCAFGKSEIKAPFSEPESNQKKSAKHEEHADFDVSYSVTCANLKGLSGLRLAAFKNLKGLVKLKVEGLIGDKAYSKVHEASSAEVSLK
jgi:hypothetical protein